MKSLLMFTLIATPKKKSTNEVQVIGNDDGSFRRQNFMISMQRFQTYYRPIVFRNFITDLM